MVNVAKHGHHHRDHHSFEERTYGNGDLEVMVDLAHNGGLIDVYTYADMADRGHLAEFDWEPGRNPNFVHAVAPQDVYAYVREAFWA